MASLFKEIKPLVNATLEASQTINRTGPILAWTQLLMILLLGAIFLVLFGLLVTLNPDLEAERKEFITPVVRLLLAKTVANGRAVRKAVGNPKWVAKTALQMFTGPFRGPNPDVAKLDVVKSNTVKDGKKTA
ncbi:hypothetical protein BKA67DRAFT_204805 [Truncatella angustata]|uniref:Uncharacterized protein n=1 Tax=Truncatella angustata TaxID=152316 RepID=A0A9P9A068_9PEZI|nr:uncharacterized protein BKA67DRAFT_204805 [Truncatella angustata]KAH6658022.1 hypothetical protein BKA67DRAFT_204805 [Truncatella angustata]KAH8201397.1 hypothetical protein TruAng_004480 [Truncatella angustata]